MVERGERRRKKKKKKKERKKKAPLMNSWRVFASLSEPWHERTAAASVADKSSREVASTSTSQLMPPAAVAAAAATVSSMPLADTSGLSTNQQGHRKPYNETQATNHFHYYNTSDITGKTPIGFGDSTINVFGLCEGEGYQSQCRN